MASSSVSTRGGVRNTFSSAAVVRMLFSFFSRTGFTCEPQRATGFRAQRHNIKRWLILLLTAVSAYRLQCTLGG